MSKETELTIGLPLFNEEKKINFVLEKIFSQKYQNFNLIISDNASTDNTFQICNEWAKKNKNIELIKQKQKLNINENFYFIYTKVKTKYFMWIAADDERSEDFIIKNIEFLDNNLNYIASSSINYVEMKDKKKTKVDFDIIGCTDQRYIKFLKNCFFSHGIFYSIFRTINLENTKQYLDYMAWDWIVNLTILKNGSFNRLKEGHFNSVYGGTSTKKEYIYNKKKNEIFKFFPFLKFMIIFYQFYFRCNFKFKDFFKSLNIFYRIHKKYFINYIKEKVYARSVKKN